MKHGIKMRQGEFVGLHYPIMKLASRIYLCKRSSLLILILYCIYFESTMQRSPQIYIFSMYFIT